MSADVIVVGAGGFGREALDVFEAVMTTASASTLLGVVDDRPSELNLARLAARGCPYLGSLGHTLDALPPGRFVLGIGSPAVRARLADMLERRGWMPLTLVHPRAGVGSMSTVGPGSVVCAGVEVSTNVTLGRQVHLNPGAIVGHDTEVHDHVSVNPGAVLSGEVVVGARTLVGAGAVVLQGLRVGADATIGASACVTRDVPPGLTMVGIPARAIAPGGQR